MAYSNKALPPGTILREWRLENVLGVGGFGIVYKGRGIYFDELVAIKEYFPSAICERRDGDTVVPTDSDVEEVHALGLKKFVEEAKLLWNLSKPTRHPNIVSVRSLFEIHGTAYMVMDFEDGLSLSEILKSGKRFSQPSLMALIRPISEGLDRAHRVGVLHRDIKPPNMLVSEDGRPVLIDFGSARFDSGQATSTKVTFHTPPYAAIEQYVKTYAQGPWTDIYALGVVLYECVTGEKPPEVLERLHGELGKPLEHGDWPGFSRSFLRAIDAAMIIRPGDRPQSIPQWLELFDLADDAPLPSFGAEADDTPTRFSAFQDLPEEIVPVVAPVVLADPEPSAGPPSPEPAVPEPAKPLPAAAIPEAGPTSPAVAPPAAAALLPQPKPKLIRTGPALLALAVSASIVVVSLYLSGQIEKLQLPGPIKTLVSPGPVVPDPTATPTEVIAPDGIPAAMQALAAEARRSGAPGAAVRALDASIAQINALAALPEAQKPKVVSQAEIDAIAKTASAALAQSAANSVNERAIRLARQYPWADANRPAAANGESPDRRRAAAALHQARQRANAAAASGSRAASAQDAVASARQALAASVQFAAASTQAQRASATIVAAPTEIGTQAPLPPATPSETAAPGAASSGMRAKIADVEAVLASARPIAARVIELGAARPGASEDDRKGYRTRQDNAKRAKGYLDHLELLSRTVRNAPSEASAAGYVTQARTVRGYLNTLLATSTTAMPR